MSSQANFRPCACLVCGIFTQLTINYKRKFRAVISQVFLRFRRRFLFLLAFCVKINSRLGVALKYFRLCATHTREPQLNRRMYGSGECSMCDIILSVLLMSFLFANIFYVPVMMCAENKMCYSLQPPTPPPPPTSRPDNALSSFALRRTRQALWGGCNVT